MRGRVEQDVVGAPGDAAVEHGFQRLVVRAVGRTRGVERQVVAEHHHAPRRMSRAAARAARGRVASSSRAISISTSAPGRSAFTCRVRGLHQRGFAHPARAPQHDVVRRVHHDAKRRVLPSRSVALPLHAAQQRGRVHAGHAVAPAARPDARVAVPDERVGARPATAGLDGGRREAFQRVGDAGERTLVDQRVHPKSVLLLDGKGGGAYGPAAGLGKPRGDTLCTDGEARSMSLLVSSAFAQVCRDRGCRRGSRATTPSTPRCCNTRRSLLIMVVFYVLWLSPAGSRSRRRRARCWRRSAAATGW